MKMRPGIYIKGDLIVYVMEDAHQARELAAILSQEALRTNDSGWRDDSDELYDTADAYEEG